MKTLKTVVIKPVTVEFVPEPENMEQDVLYISAKYKTASHLCLCGCKSLVITPMNDTGWSGNFDLVGRWSMSPSIGNYNLPCKSHYIITNNKANFV